MSKSPPVDANGNMIKISVTDGFKKAKASLVERPYLLSEDYKTNFSDKIINNITETEIDVGDSYAIIFSDFKNKVGKLVTEKEFLSYKIYFPSNNVRPGFVHVVDANIYLVKQMTEDFAFSEDETIYAGKPGDYLVAIPHRHDYRIFNSGVFDMNFTLMENKHG